MTKEDFNLYRDCDNIWESKELFTYEDDQVKFNYRWYIEKDHLLDDETGGYRYVFTTYILVDRESRGGRHNREDDWFSPRTYGFWMREREIRESRKLDIDKEFNKCFDQIDRIKIGPKLKKDKYTRIKAIINGDSFYVR